MRFSASNIIASQKLRHDHAVNDALKKIVKKLLWNVVPDLLPDSVFQQEEEYKIALLRAQSLQQLNAVEPEVLLCRQFVEDFPAAFVADPFLVLHQGQQHLFFEVMSAINFLGSIAVARMDSDGVWKYDGIALNERFHTAYPQVFVHQDRFFMVPDTPTQGVRLYEAERYPHQWRLVSTLVPPGNLADPTVVIHDGRWWLFCYDLSEKRLRVFHSETLEGRWREVGAVNTPDGDLRGAGSIISTEGRLLRFVQNGAGPYGSYVRAHAIVRLEPDMVCEVDYFENPILQASGHGWNAHGMHHIDAHAVDGGWLAAVDGRVRHA